MFMLRARPVVRTLRARAHICMHLRSLIHPNSNYAMKYCAFKKDFFYVFTPISMWWSNCWWMGQGKSWQRVKKQREKCILFERSFCAIPGLVAHSIIFLQKQPQILHNFTKFFGLKFSIIWMILLTQNGLRFCSENVRKNRFLPHSFMIHSYEENTLECAQEKEHSALEFDKRVGKSGNTLQP